MKNYSDSINKFKREPIEIKRPVTQKQTFIGDEKITKSEFSRRLFQIQRSLKAKTRKVVESHERREEIEPVRDRFDRELEDRKLMEEVMMVQDKFYTRVNTRGPPKPKLIQTLLQS